ncbi:flagellin [Paenibacillus sp. FSL H8-0317]|uniref:flagellin N-terminal helical domain-containing protein n=1 Tax=Paenibacillus sp. FSL H8-0317 TaxID=2921385 RepID=UPI00324D4FFB
MIINHNIAALNTHRQLSTNTANTNKNIEKLSSGLRINRAGDDAAGLAISEKMRGQIRGLDQATRNAQDGISLIQTAEGALNETHSILQRMRELAVQSSNDTNTEQDRGELQKEMNQLTSEINRIGNTTEFNTKKLLNGDLSDKFMTKAAVTTPATTVDVNKAITQTIKVGEEPIAWSKDSSQVAFDVKFTGKAANGFDWGAVNEASAAGKNEIKIERDADGFKLSFDGIDKTGTPLNLEIDAQALAYDNATDTYSFNNEGISFSFKGADAKDWAVGESVTMDLKKANGGTGNLTTAAVNTIPTSQEFATDNSTGATKAALTGFKVDATNAQLLANVSDVKVTLAGTDLTVDLLDKDGNSVSSTKFSGVGATFNYDANGIKFDLAKGNATALEGTFKLETATAKVEVVGPEISPAEYEDRSASFQIGANQNQSLSLGVNDMRAAALGITGTGKGFSAADNVTDGTDNKNAEKALDLTSNTNAASAITTVDKAIASVSSERSKLGAVQNRLEHTINNLGTSSENLTAAESRIRDVDMAKEMMSQTKNNILAQAAQAMLAQANQQPQGVLQLLR